MDVNITRNFNEKIRRMLNSVSYSELNSILEIRMRTNKPLSVYSCNNSRYLTSCGALSEFSQQGYIVTSQDINDTYNIACQYSVHSFQRELSKGFITVNGGHRVGLCGTAVYTDNQLMNIKNISSVNFRIARQINGCADEVCNSIFASGVQSLLIVGPPSSGKTTILKDICRQLGKRHKISIIDERGEIASVYNGIAQNDIGINTDVLDGYNKAEGIETAVRVMSPEIIVCDEIGNSEDVSAVIHSMNCGVKLIATAHAISIRELLRKPSVNEIIRYGVFDNIVFLSDTNTPGKIKKIIRTDSIDKTYWLNSDNCNDKPDRKLYV